MYNLNVLKVPEAAGGEAWAAGEPEAGVSDATLGALLAGAAPDADADADADAELWVRRRDTRRWPLPSLLLDNSQFCIENVPEPRDPFKGGGGFSKCHSRSPGEGGGRVPCHVTVEYF